MLPSIKNDRETIGKRIRERRELKHLSQDEMAKIIGIQRATLSRIESGVTDPKAIYIANIAAVLDTSCDFLINGTETRNIEISKELGIPNEIIEVFRKMDQFIHSDTSESDYDPEIRKVYHYAWNVLFPLLTDPQGLLILAAIFEYISTDFSSAFISLDGKIKGVASVKALQYYNPLLPYASIEIPVDHMEEAYLLKINELIKALKAKSKVQMEAMKNE